MRLAATGAAIVLALSTPALAQGRGYPASPSHAVMGAPNPDGSPRYGSEQGKGAKPADATIGSGSGAANGNREASGPEAAGTRGAKETEPAPPGR